MTSFVTSSAGRAAGKPGQSLGGADLVYCLTDEAALMSGYALLPILRCFLGYVGLRVAALDVSFGARVASIWPAASSLENPVLNELGALALGCSSRIVKPPSMSANLEQLRAVVHELRARSCSLPDYPVHATTTEELEIRRRYDQTLGSRVNATLRVGNSERTAPSYLRPHARRHLTDDVGVVPPRSHVATMGDGDFQSTERAFTTPYDAVVRVVHEARSGAKTPLGSAFNLSAGDIVDCSVLRRAALRRFLMTELEACRREQLLFSIQLKCTTMRASDPLMLGDAVACYFAPLFTEFPSVCAKLDTTTGFKAIDAAELGGEREAFDALVERLRLRGPRVAEPGVPGAVGRSSIAAVMAEALRNGMRLTGPDGRRDDTKFVIPDRTYADLYRALIDDYKANGPWLLPDVEPTLIVGLTAAAAHEYGSQDTTFEISKAGWVRLLDDRDRVLCEHEVDAGDIWRLCRCEASAVVDWSRRGLEHAERHERAAVFWLDEQRPRDRELLRIVRSVLASTPHRRERIAILGIAAAARRTFAMLRAGQPVIALTGNVVRDYLSELIGAIEHDTGSWSCVTTALPGQGALFEAGSSGCAPRPFRDFLRTNHLRWSPIGELLAVRAALEHAARSSQSTSTLALGRTLQDAIQRVLRQGRLPSRHVGELDTRGSQFFLALEWALGLAQEGPTARRFTKLAERLADERGRIVEELRCAQGQEVNLGGYFLPDPRLAHEVMLPSRTFNAALCASDEAWRPSW